MKKEIATAVFLVGMSPLAQALNFGSLQYGQRKISKSKPPQATARRARVRIQKVLARVTAFWASEDHWSRRHKTATGRRLNKSVVAVDPRRIPFGSKVKFPDGEALQALDTGSAVKTRKAARKCGRTLEEQSALVVDRFFETRREAYAWLKRNPLFMVLEIEPPNPL